MSMSQGMTGPAPAGQQGTPNRPLTLTKDSGLRSADAHARYMDAVLAGNVYTASTQAGVATTVGLSTTVTGIALSNPPNSGKLLILWELLGAFSTAPAGIATVGLQASPAVQATDSTHTTPLTVKNALWGSALAGSGKADSAATFIGTPIAARAVPGGPVATGSVTAPYVKDEIAGALVLLPGTAIGTFSLTTAISALWTLTWEEAALAMQYP